MSKGWVLILGLLVLWRCGVMGKELWAYWRVDTWVPVVVKGQEVKGEGSVFVLEVVYEYVVGGKVYRGMGCTGKPYFLNRYSAKRDVKGCWVRRSCPEISQLERVFPMKELIYGLVAIGVFVYFLFGYALEKKVQQEA